MTEFTQLYIEKLAPLAPTTNNNINTNDNNNSNNSGVPANPPAPVDTAASAGVFLLPTPSSSGECFVPGAAGEAGVFTFDGASELAPTPVAPTSLAPTPVAPTPQLTQMREITSEAIDTTEQAIPYDEKAINGDAQTLTLNSNHEP